MVNTGQPSKACVQCRARRVRCDEGRPACHHCIRLGIQCPGYPSRPNLTFQDDTTRTQRRAQRIYQSLNRRENSRAGRSASHSSTEADSDRPRRPSLTPVDSFSFTPMFDALSLTFFADQITTGSISSFIRDLNSESITLYIHNLTFAASIYPSCSNALKATVELLAMSMFANSPASEHVDVTSTSIMLYGRAIKEVNEAVQNISEENFEQTILTVEVLAIAELCLRIHDEPVEETQKRTRAHFNGMTALVAHRGSALFATETGRRLFFDVFISHVMWNGPLPRPQPWPIASDATDILLQCPFTPRSPEYSLLPLLQRSLELRITAVDTLAVEAIASESSIRTLKIIAVQLRNDLEEWWNELPVLRKLNTHRIQQMLLNIYQVHIIFVEDVHVRCCHMLEILDAAVDRYVADIATSIRNAQEAVGLICNRLPYSFTERDLVPVRAQPLSTVETLCAISHSHPLLVCSMVQNISEGQNQGIQYARQACARASGLPEPLRTLPRTLMPTS